MLAIINSAQAATTTPAAATSNIDSFLLLLAFVVIFYFLMWRPQVKRAKEQRNLIANLSQGDEVVTSGGIIGKINKLSDDFIVLGLNDTVEIKLQRSAVASILPKGSMQAM